MPEREPLRSGVEKTHFLSCVCHGFDELRIFFVSVPSKESGQVTGFELFDACRSSFTSIFGCFFVIAGRPCLSSLFERAILCNMPLHGAVEASSIFPMLFFFCFSGCFSYHAQVYSVGILRGETGLCCLGVRISSSFPEEVAMTLLVL